MFIKQPKHQFSRQFVLKHSSAGEAKIRYIAGACSNKISSRLRNSVLMKIGKTTKKSKIARRLDYKKHAMLKKFRIEEDEAPQNSSMSEIQKQFYFSW
jgi:hypothetical protein